MKKLLKYGTFLIFLSVLINSCEDVINLEDNIDKKRIVKPLTPNDSLKNLVCFAGIKFDPRATDGKGQQSMGIPLLYNKSYEDTIIIYNLNYKNPAGIFFYRNFNGKQLSVILPITLAPKESVGLSISFPFDMMSVYPPGKYYDTIFVNNNPKYFVPVEGEITN